MKLRENTPLQLTLNEIHAELDRKRERPRKLLIEWMFYVGLSSATAKTIYEEWARSRGLSTPEADTP